jgi:immunity protein 27 of polymorphic toxin system
MSTELPYEPPLDDECVIHATDQDSYNRISRIVRYYFTYITQNGDGSSSLYRDPFGDFWLRIYPHFEQHGGGRPVLRRVTDEEARQFRRSVME